MLYRIRLNLDDSKKFDEGQYDAPPGSKRLSLFGHPVSEGEMLVDSINTIRLERIRYDFHLGPLLD